MYVCMILTKISNINWFKRRFRLPNEAIEYVKLLFRVICLHPYHAYCRKFWEDVRKILALLLIYYFTSFFFLVIYFVLSHKDNAFLISITVYKSSTTTSIYVTTTTTVIYVNRFSKIKYSMSNAAIWPPGLAQDFYGFFYFYVQIFRATHVTSHL